MPHTAPRRHSTNAQSKTRASCTPHHSNSVNSADFEVVYLAPAHGGRKSTSVQPPSSIHTLSLHGSDKPSSQNQTINSPP
jgi:hypothetical protein